LSLIILERSSATHTLIILVDTARKDWLAGTIRVEVVVFTARNTNSLLILCAVHIFLVTFVVCSQILIRFAN